MTLKQWSDEVASTLELRMKELVDCIHESHLLLLKIQGMKENVSDGRSIRFPVIVQPNESGGWFANYDNLDMNPSKHLGEGTLPFAQHQAAITACGRELKTNRGKSQFIDMMSVKTAEAEEKVRRDFEHAIIFGNGNDPKMMHGLPLILGSGPYAGIDPAVKGCEWWQPYRIDPLHKHLAAGAPPESFRAPPFTLNALLEMSLCIDGGRTRPDCVILAKDLYMGLVESLGSSMYMQSSKTVALGIETISYMGMDITYDLKLPNGTGYAINSKYMKLWCYEDCFMTFSGFKEPVDQDAIYGHIMSMLQLGTNKRCAHGVICNFAPAC